MDNEHRVEVYLVLVSAVKRNGDVEALTKVGQYEYHSITEARLAIKELRSLGAVANLYKKLVD
jgi:hypothetical protein